MAKAKVTQLHVQEHAEIPYESDAGKFNRIRITVDGIYALLTHNPESMHQTKEASKGGRIPEPEVEAEAGTYRMADGTCAIKGEAFRGSMLGAAGAWKEKRASLRSRLAHVIVLEELVPLCRKDGTPISEYAIDARRAIIQKQGIIRRRPRFEEWSATFTVEYDPLILPDPTLMLKIFADAGVRMGVGDYRPHRGGWFGPLPREVISTA